MPGCSPALEPGPWDHFIAEVALSQSASGDCQKTSSLGTPFPSNWWFLIWGNVGTCEGGARAALSNEICPGFSWKWVKPDHAQCRFQRRHKDVEEDTERSQYWAVVTGHGWPQVPLCRWFGRWLMVLPIKSASRKWATIPDRQTPFYYILETSLIWLLPPFLFHLSLSFHHSLYSRCNDFGIRQVGFILQVHFPYHLLGLCSPNHSI